LFCQERRKELTEVLIQTFIRKQLGLKAHKVTAVELTEAGLAVHVDRLGNRRLQCGLCRRPAGQVYDRQRQREWLDLSMRGVRMVLRYPPRRVRCRHCGVHVEAFPWAEPWARVTRALAGAVVVLARSQSWQETARLYGLNWKSVAGMVRRAVEYGLAQRRHKPLHWIGIDEVSRKKGHQYLTVVYDLERRVLVWVGEERTEQTLAKFFTGLGARRCATVRIVCMDMWAAYAKAVREKLPNAQILFDRFHVVQHLNQAVDEVRRSEMRRLNRRERVAFKKTRYLLLKNPWNLSRSEQDRLSTLVRWNTPIVRAYYLKESFQMFWDYQQPARSEAHLQQWMRAAKRTRLKAFKGFVHLLEAHLDGILAWTKLRLSNGALEGMNNKIKLVSHRSFGFRSARNFITAIYHCCAKLPLPDWM
jgi:transposase